MSMLQWALILDMEGSIRKEAPLTLLPEVRSSNEIVTREAAKKVNSRKAHHRAEDSRANSIQ
jgi:hypothetical protein